MLHGGGFGAQSLFGPSVGGGPPIPRAVPPSFAMGQYGGGGMRPPMGMAGTAGMQGLGGGQAPGGGQPLGGGQMNPYLEALMQQLGMGASPGVPQGVPQAAPPTMPPQPAFQGPAVQRSLPNPPPPAMTAGQIPPSFAQFMRPGGPFGLPLTMAVAPGSATPPTPWRRYG